MRGERRWDLWLAAAGFGMAAGDFAFFSYLDIDMSVAGRDVTAGLFVWFAVSFAAFGFVIGRLIQARARAAEAARTIEAQMQALEASQRALAQNQKLAAMGRLAAGIAHEVRNPLGVIRASASMVQESFDPGDEAHRACGFIKQEIDRLNGLISSLLNFARPTELRLQSVAIEKLIERALHLASDQIEGRRIRIERESDGILPPVNGDPDLLAQVLLNLVANAAQALGEEGRITLFASGKNGEVRIEVRDDGPGISAEDESRIFEPFFTTKASGTGLGLSMAARIAEAHGGRLEFVPPAGPGAARGACFRLRLSTEGPSSGRTERS